MKAASIQEIRSELQALDKKSVVDICLRLARFRVDNKELVTYLLFESSDEGHYVDAVKVMLRELFDTMNTSHLYFARKTLRKIIRQINKYSRYSGKPETEAEWRIFFCEQLISSGIPYAQSEGIMRLYAAQRKKAVQVIEKLHEDLQHEFEPRLQSLPA